MPPTPKRRLKILIVSGAFVIFAASISIPITNHRHRSTKAKHTKNFDDLVMVDSATDQYATEVKNPNSEPREVNWRELRNSMNKKADPQQPSFTLDTGKETPNTLDLPNQKIQRPVDTPKETASDPGSLPLHILSDPKIPRPDYGAPPKK